MALRCRGLAERRRQSGHTQEQLAYLLGVEHSAVVQNTTTTRPSPLSGTHPTYAVRAAAAEGRRTAGVASAQQ